MNITITINTDNDAFEDLTGEVARILHDAADKIDGNSWFDAGYSFPLYDYNGNEVGYVSVK